MECQAKCQCQPDSPTKNDGPPNVYLISKQQVKPLTKIRWQTKEPFQLCKRYEQKIVGADEAIEDRKPSKKDLSYLALVCRDPSLDKFWYCWSPVSPNSFSCQKQLSIQSERLGISL